MGFRFRVSSCAILSRPAAVLVALLAAVRLLAAENPAETAAFNAASRLLIDGFWQKAELSFAEFIQKFTNSAHLPEAVLYQARARYEMSNYTGAIALLSTNQPRAGAWADQYLFWLGQAQLKMTNYAAAGDAFAQLVRSFPTSPVALEAAVGEATSWAKRGDWRRVVVLLQKPDGVFQATARTNTIPEPVLRGSILLGESLFLLQDLPAAERTLLPLTKAQLPPKHGWELHFLLCRIWRAQGHPEAALANCTNLQAAAAAAADFGLKAESFAFQGELLESLHQPDSALIAYTNNLADGIPPERQRQALLKLAALSVARTNLAVALARLDEFAARRRTAPPADLALLLLGELRLRQYVTGPATNRPPASSTNLPPGTNDLQRAVAALTELTGRFPQSSLLGKAHLDLGWCLWEQADWAGCQANCAAALERLPVSADQALARFKLADAQYQVRNFAAAFTNYSVIPSLYARLPDAPTNLFEPALYQAVRAALEGGLLPAATATLAQLLARYPDGFHTDHAHLLAGEAIWRRNPAAALGILTNFARAVPEAPLLPEISLTIGRAYEELNLPLQAVAEYTRWLERFTNSALRPRAEYALALAQFYAGNETNAFTRFTNFVAHCATNELWSLAQWWIGDYYYRHGPQANAELAFALLCQTTNLPPGHELLYQARMMAGRSAVACQHWKNAIYYFTNLTSDARCRREYPALWTQAMLACGDTSLVQESTNRVEDCKWAIEIFKEISEHPTNRVALLALGEKAIAYAQYAQATGNYYELTNAALAYQQVLAASNADIGTRSMAQVGLADVCEKQAEHVPPAGRKPLLEQALSFYLSVFEEANLRPGEQPDPFWVEEAGRKAARLLDTGGLQNPQQAIKVYERLKRCLPPLGPWLDQEILKARVKANAQ